MNRTVLATAALAAVVALIAGVSGSAAVTLNHTDKTIRVLQSTTSIHMPPGGFSPGATVTITSKLTSHGVQVGTTQIACVVVEGTKAQCQATTLFSSGQIQSQGPFDLSNPSGDAAIAGGTGAYKTARGYITRETLTATTSQVTYHISS
jgi:hypothetical protein